MVDFNSSAPVVVKKALLLLCAGLALALLAGLTEYWQMPTEVTVIGDTTLALSNLFIVLVALGANIVFIRLRMNWARYLLALLFVLSVPSLLHSIFKAFHTSHLLALMELAQLAAEGYALYLLFTPQARDWFESE